MELTLRGIEQHAGSAQLLYPLDLDLVPNAVTVLLGATQAGKTTLMRLMAGLDAPSRGRIRVDGEDMTGRSVRQRNVAMVYQQFINYPSMTVADNIASPLKLSGGLTRAAIAERVQSLAERLHIEPFLQRLPAELSGGQQQRVALARALAKSAPLMLLDEPLVNLDYKLREELRDELSQLFAAGESTVVYATTEPAEALLLGGHTAVLDAGRLLQYGPTAQVFHRPRSVAVARAFSDPPMNLLAATASADGVVLSGAGNASVRLPTGGWAHNAGRAPVGTLTVGLRASALRVGDRPGDVALPGRVELAEISGSDTFVHVDTALGELVAQLTGVHQLALNQTLTLYVNPAQVYVFDTAGKLLIHPTNAAARLGLDAARKV